MKFECNRDMFSIAAISDARPDDNQSMAHADDLKYLNQSGTSTHVVQMEIHALLSITAELKLV